MYRNINKPTSTQSTTQLNTQGETNRFNNIKNSVSRAIGDTRKTIANNFRKSDPNIVMLEDSFKNKKIEKILVEMSQVVDLKNPNDDTGSFQATNIYFLTDNENSKYTEIKKALDINTLNEPNSGVFSFLKTKKENGTFDSNFDSTQTNAMLQKLENSQTKRIVTAPFKFTTDGLTSDINDKIKESYIIMINFMTDKIKLKHETLTSSQIKMMGVEAVRFGEFRSLFDKLSELTKQYTTTNSKTDERLLTSLSRLVIFWTYLYQIINDSFKTSDELTSIASMSESVGKLEAINRMDLLKIDNKYSVVYMVRDTIRYIEVILLTINKNIQFPSGLGDEKIYNDLSEGVVDFGMVTSEEIEPSYTIIDSYFSENEAIKTIMNSMSETDKPIFNSAKINDISTLSRNNIFGFGRIWNNQNELTQFILDGKQKGESFYESWISFNTNPLELLSEKNNARKAYQPEGEGENSTQGGGDKTMSSEKPKRRSRRKYSTGRTTRKRRVISPEVIMNTPLRDLIKKNEVNNDADSYNDRKELKSVDIYNAHPMKSVRI
jgi:hypothetical protein